MATRRRRCLCWFLPALLMVPLFFVVAGLAKGPIERGLAARARAALASQGIEGVSVRGHSWGDLRLTGPADRRTAALAAVEGMRHRGDANSIRYVDAAPAGAATTAAATTTAPATTVAASTTTTVARTTTTVARTTTTTAVAATTTVAPTTTTAAATTTSAAPVPTTAPLGGVDVTASIAGRRITLTGVVASEAQRAALVADAEATFGALNVTDQLQVRPGTTVAGVDVAVQRLAAVVVAFGPTVQTGQARLVDTTLTVSGTAFTAESAVVANETVGVAGLAGGVTVSGTVAEPATPDRATLQQRLADLLGRSGINFDPDSAVITPESEAILETAAQSIQSIADTPIEVGGHTDNQGSAAANQALSEARAQAVRQNLIDKGVSADQLTAVGYGPTRPIADNATPDGRAANRRIEFTTL